MSAAESLESRRADIRWISAYVVAAWSVCAVIMGIARRGAFPVGLAIPLAMLTPMLLALVFQALERRAGRNPPPLVSRLPKGRTLLAAWVAAAAYPLLSVGLSILIAPDILQPAASMASAIAKLRTGMGDSASPSAGFALAFMISLVVGPLVNLPILLGEETGWRAYLGQRLMKAFGLGGVVLTGVVWALWHLPMILLGLNYPGQPLAIVLLIWVPLCVGMSIILQLLYERGGLWSCAICHGVVNQLSVLILVVFVRREAFNPIVLGPQGIVGLVVLAVPALLSARALCRIVHAPGLQTI